MTQKVELNEMRPENVRLLAPFRLVLIHIYLHCFESEIARHSHLCGVWVLDHSHPKIKIWQSTSRLNSVNSLPVNQMRLIGAL